MAYSISQSALCNITVTEKDLSKIVEFLVRSETPFSVTFSKSEKEVSSFLDFETIQIRIKNDYTSSIAITPGSTCKINKDKLNGIIENLLKEGIVPVIDVIAGLLSLTPRKFKTYFKKEYQKTFYHYYMEKKMAYAAELLKEGHIASDVSKKMGYSHPIKFNKMFQKYYGITPKKYQTMNMKS